jgi:predicted MFS family arabinose efflux permease
MLQNTLQLYKKAYANLSKEVWILSGISLVNRAGAMVFPFMTIYLTQSMNFTYKEAGIIMSFFGMGSILGSYLGGLLTDKFGDYKVQFWSLLLSSIVFLFVLKMKTFWEMAFIAFLISTVADAFRPANKVAVANYSEPENLTRSFALLRLAVNVGFAIGPALGGLLAAWKGYEWLFYADALTCFVAAILFRLSLKDQRKEKTEKEQKIEKEVVISAHRSPYKDTLFLLFLVLIAILAFAFMQLFYTIPVFFKQEISLNERQIGLLMGLNGVIIVLVEMPLVYLAERQFSKFATMTLGAFLIGLGYLCFLWPSPSLFLAAGVITILTFGEIYYMPFASAFTAERAPDSNKGQYMALYSISWSVASVIAPSTGFQIVEKLGFNNLWLILFSLSLISGLGLLYLGKKVMAAPLYGKVKI